MACSRMPKCRIRPYGDWLLPNGEVGETTVPVGQERAAALDGGVVALREVGAAADELGQGRRDGLDDLAARLAGRDVLAGGEHRQREVRRGACRRRGGRGVPPGRRSAARHAAYCLVPGGAVGRTAGVDLAGVGEDVVGDGEALRRVEAEQLLGRRDLVGAERGAVRLEGVAQVRRRPADDRLEPDERRALGLGARGVERGREAEHVDAAVGQHVDALHVPAVRRVARPDVLAEGDGGVVLDRDLVVVPDDREVAELLRPGERRRLGGDALLEVAVGADHPHVVVERAGAGARRRGRAGRARSAGPSPCRPRSRGPARADRWWSRRPACGGARGDPA